MNTPLHHIFNEDFVGQTTNPLSFNEILHLAGQEKSMPIDSATPKILFLGIDIQLDFMDSGALGVPGAKQDIIRLANFLYNNSHLLSKMIVSLDTHEPKQIFHPCWWVDKNDQHPNPFTIIKSTDLTEGKWKALVDPALSKNYVRHLEKANKNLCIWPYHCIQGTTGHALDCQFSNLINFISLAQNIPLTKIQKGQYPHSEMYGIIKPEYSLHDHTNLDLLQEIATYDKIVIAGEAKSHCVLESIRQICEYYFDKPEITRKLYILTDCMSDIPGFEEQSATSYAILTSKYKINLVKSTDNFLE